MPTSFELKLFLAAAVVSACSTLLFFWKKRKPGNVKPFTDPAESSDDKNTPPAQTQISLPKSEKLDNSTERSNDKVIQRITWTKFRLQKVIPVNYNTSIFRFSLPPNNSLNIPPGQHVSVMFEDNGQIIMR